MKAIKPFMPIIPAILMLVGCNPPQSSDPADDTLTLFSLAGPDTRVVFNQPPDLRYAWLGNDAEHADFETEIIDLINNATTTLDVSTMTFSKINIAEALDNAVASGVDVRVIGGGFRRWQPGFWRSLAGGAEVVDNNLPALVHRVTFQTVPGAPAGWVVDQGQAFGPKPGGLNYGWDADRSASMMDHGLFSSPIIDDSMVRQNSQGGIFWEIEVPNGFYYVHLMVGQANNGFSPDNYVQVEGLPVFFTSAPGYFTTFFTNTEGDQTDLFKGCGVDPDDARRIQVTDGRLTVQLGDNSEGSFSSLAYIEIYRADQVSAAGDRCQDDGTDDEVQERQLQHAKYIVADRGLPTARLWASSGNLTQSMDGTVNSEDAIISTNANLINAFVSHFNQQWGSNTLQPQPATSNFGMCKDVVPGLDMTINGFDWHVRFSPSVTPGYDMVQETQNFINASNDNLVMVLEQFRFSGGFNGFTAPLAIRDNTIPAKLGIPGYELYAIGGEEFNTNPWNTFANAHVTFAVGADPPPGIHNKYVLADALYDTRHTLSGKVLAGSMNWSQSGFHTNDEQTLIIENPYVANQYLQNAMQRLADFGVEPDRKADIILVLDRSLSMNQPTQDGMPKIDAMRAASKLFLDILEDDEAHFVSMIRFGATVEPFAPAITLQDFTAGRRTTLKNEIDNIVADAPIGNATCYGLPLTEARDQFMNSSSGNPRQIIHFFTDGKHNTPPDPSTEIPALQAMGVEIHSTGFGSDAVSTYLLDIAQQTGGTYEVAPLTNLDLTKRFAEVARDAMDLGVILDPRYTLEGERVVREQVYVDKKSEKLKFVFTWDIMKERLVEPAITSPGGKQLTAQMPGVRYAHGPGYLVVSVDAGKAEALKMEGYWTVVLRAARGVGSLTTDLMVYGDSDIILQAEVFPADRSMPGNVTVLARLLDEGQPVIRNSISVEVQYPYQKQEPKKIVLFDDGKHNDGKAEDGLYGARVSGLDPGNYNFHFISEATIRSNNQVHRDTRVSYSFDLDNEELLKEYRITTKERKD
ncbi:MAG: phospholipase D-like domain-containing protein [Cyclobacteriaceae bacterium]